MNLLKKLKAWSWLPKRLIGIAVDQNKLQQQLNTIQLNMEMIEARVSELENRSGGMMVRKAREGEVGYYD